MAIYITNGTSEDSEINSFSYKEAGYSIDNTVRKDGKLYIAAASVSRDTIIEHDGTEFVQNLSTSEYATIKKGENRLLRVVPMLRGSNLWW